MITPVVRVNRFVIFSKSGGNPYRRGAGPRGGQFTDGPGGAGRGGAPRDVAGRGAYAGGGGGKKTFADSPKRPEKSLADRTAEQESITDVQYKRYAATPKTLGHSDAMMFARRPATAAQMGKFAALTETQRIAYRQGVNGKLQIPHADMLKVVTAKRTGVHLKDYHEADYAERMEFAKVTGKPIPPGHSAIMLHDNWRARAKLTGDKLVGPDGKSQGFLGSGLDSKGKPQPYYTQAHTDYASKTKYNRLTQTAKALPALDKALAKAAGTSAGDAAMLIRKTGIRPDSGANTGAKEKAYGATTLEARHVVSINGNTVHFKYQAKDGVLADWKITDPALAKMIAKRKATAQKSGGDSGQLFPKDTPKGSVYENMTTLIQGSGVGVVKDLRTYIGTTTASSIVKKMPVPKTPAEYKTAVQQVAILVSKKLINKPNQCLESYISPSVFAAWQGALAE